MGAETMRGWEIQGWAVLRAVNIVMLFCDGVLRCMKVVGR